MPEIIPLHVPVVMCLAINHGCVDGGVRIPIAQAVTFRPSHFCGGCAARAPCEAHHNQSQLKETP